MATTLRRPKLIGIAGLSGSGKSWLAQELRADLGGAAALLSLDDFYRDRAHLTMRQRERLNFDHPRAIDWECLEQLLMNCRQGEELQLPCYDFKAHARAEESRLWRVEPVVILEGLWAWWRPRLRPYFDYKIFIDAPEELCFRRRLERDQQERGRELSSVRRQFAERVWPMGRRYVLPQAQWADLVLRSPVRADELRQLAGRIRALAEGSADERRLRP